MKHILPLTLLLIAPAASAANPLEYYSAPNSSVMAPNMDGATKIMTAQETVSGDGTPVTKRAIQYDGDLLPVGISNFGSAAGAWVASGGIAYEWDDAGRCLKRVETDDSGRPKYEYKYAYDQWGRMTKFAYNRYFYDEYSGARQEVDATVFSYDEEGRLLSRVKTTSMTDEGEDVFNDKYRTVITSTYEAGADGVKRKVRGENLTYVLLDGNEQLASGIREEYAYSNNGDDRVVINISSNYYTEDGKWYPMRRHENTYRWYVNGFIDLPVKMESYTYVSETESLLSESTVATLEENVNGHPVKIQRVTTYYDHDNGNMTVTSMEKEEAYYDLPEFNGYKMQRLREMNLWSRQSESEEWQRIQYRIAEYDAMNNQTLYETTAYRDGKLLSGSRNEYVYDDLGRRLSKSDYRVNDLNKVMELTRVTEYTYYAATDAMLSVKTSLVNNGVPELNSTTEYEYDYAVPSENVCDWCDRFGISGVRASGSFLILSEKTTSVVPAGETITRYTYADRSDLSGVEGVAAEAVAEGAAEYYDLRGVRVAAPNLAPGLYIRRQGASATKVLIR